MSSYAQFQERWEREAGAEYDRYMARPAGSLLADVIAGRYGKYYQLWRAVAAKATLAEAAWPLFAVLRSGAPYLDRYHCADALLSLLGTPAYDPVRFTGGRPDQAAQLDRLELLLRERVGEPSAAPDAP